MKFHYSETHLLIKDKMFLAMQISEHISLTKII